MFTNGVRLAKAPCVSDPQTLFEHVGYAIENWLFNLPLPLPMLWHTGVSYSICIFEFCLFYVC